VSSGDSVFVTVLLMLNNFFVISFMTCSHLTIVLFLHCALTIDVM